MVGAANQLSGLTGDPTTKEPLSELVNCQSARRLRLTLVAGAILATGCQGDDRTANESSASIAQLTSSLDAAVGDAGVLASCGVTLTASLTFQGSTHVDGTATLSQSLPFLIPAVLPITVGGSKNGQASLQFSQSSGSSVTCRYELHNAASSFTMKSCDNGAAAGALEHATNFVLHIQNADHGAGTSGNQIQISVVLAAPDGTVCSDGNPCTRGDVCTVGKCTGAPGGCITAATRPPLSAWYQLPLTQTDAGTLVLMKLPGVSLQIDPHRSGWVTALADCTAMIVHCYAPPTPSLDDCVAAAPACATNTPWTEPQTCCPTVCATAYQSARAGGQDALTAFRNTYLVSHGGCFPGSPQP